MAEAEDTDVQQAMSLVRGTWRVWLLLIVTGGAGVFGIHQLRGQRNLAEHSMKQADAKAVQKQVEVAVLEAARTELEGRVDRLEQESAKLRKIADAQALAAKTEEEQRIVLESIRGRLEEQMKPEITTSEMSFGPSDRNVSVTIAERMLFETPDANLHIKGLEMLARLGAVLSEAKGYEVEVSGHLDPSPIPKEQAAAFPTAWELSAARAAAVVRFFQEKSKIAPEMLSARGYGAQRPIASNKTPKGRQQNRRIEVHLVPPPARPTITPEAKAAPAAPAGSPTLAPVAPPPLAPLAPPPRPPSLAPGAPDPVKH